MPSTQTSPNMNITVPVALSDPGPDWAQRIQTALFTTIDSHDHTSGKGLPITPAAMNVNADLTFGGFNATNLRSARLVSQGIPLALGTDIGCLSNVLGDAYWNNGAGVAIQLTKNGAVFPPSFLAPRSVSGSFSVGANDSSVALLVDTTGGAATCTLPLANTVPAGRELLLIDYKGKSEVNTITVTPTGADNINGANASYVFARNYGSLILVGDGIGNWTAVPWGFPYAPWQGSRNTQQGTLQTIPWQFHTADTSAHNILSVTVPNNSVAIYHIEFCVKNTGGSGNAAMGNQFVMAINNAGTLTGTQALAGSSTLGVSPLGAIQSQVTGTTLNVQIVAANSSSADWMGVARLQIN